MSEFSPTFDQAYAYYSYRLPDQRLQKRDQVYAKCAFHGDKTASMSLNFKDGLWNCHACNVGGGIFDFERKMFPTKSVDDTWKEIYRITGAEPPKQTHRIVKTYDYVDPKGKLLYQKVRYEPKRFNQRQPVGDGQWRWNLDGVKKVLYNLPSVVSATFVTISEGEKDCDNLKAAFDAQLPQSLAVKWGFTTNFDGAGKWLPQYAPYFSGKQVVILVDNDAVGIAHGERVAASVVEYADTVKLILLAGLPEHGDASDWLEQGHTVQELYRIIKNAPVWRPKPTEHILLAELKDFLEIAPPDITWLVEGLIPEGRNGIIVADPKAGKSVLAIDLALALASGSSWLGHIVPRRRRVALVSREDHPAETARRLRSIQGGSDCRNEYTWGQIWVNTRHQSEEFLLENGEHVDQLIAELKMEQIDLVIFDVFRRMHNLEENDNTEMSKPIAALSRIQTEVKCSVAMVHHITKLSTGNIFRDIRGAGAIHGWTEWGVGLTVVDESVPRKEWVRRAEFELKADAPADFVWFKFSGEENTLRVDLCGNPNPEEKKQQQPKPRQKVEMMPAAKSLPAPAKNFCETREDA
jgi:hypothetical protein